MSIKIEYDVQSDTYEVQINDLVLGLSIHEVELLSVALRSILDAHLP